jgi:DNA-binding MarR family transcriptional regulator
MKITKYLNASPVFAINSAYEAIISDINRVLKTEDSNLLQGLVLTALLFEEKDTITPSKLAQVFHTSRGNISHIVSHLEYRGWVKRVVSPTDARQFQIVLKPDGRKKAVKLVKYYDKIQDLFENQLGISNCKQAAESISKLKETYLNHHKKEQITFG